MNYFIWFRLWISLSETELDANAFSLIEKCDNIFQCDEWRVASIQKGVPVLALAGDFRENAVSSWKALVVKLQTQVENAFDSVVHLWQSELKQLFSIHFIS